MKSSASDAVRTAVRFPLQLALHLKTEGGTVDAITHDISSSGLLFSTPYLAKIGSVIEFTLDLPSDLMGWARGISIDCVGRVVRYQFAGQETMMAAEIEQYTLRAQL
jgi:hypothetical protein